MSSLIKLIYHALKDEIYKPFTYSYVDDVLKNIKSTLHKSSIRSELNDHIEESIHYYANQGFSKDDAYFLTTEAMGNPEDISDGFNEIYNWQYSLLFISKTVAFIAVIGFALTTLNPLFKAYSNSLEIQNSPLYHDGALEIRLIEEEIQFGELILRFKSASLMEDGSLLLHFNSSLKNPLMRFEPTVSLDSKCGEESCNYSNQGTVFIGYPDGYGLEYFTITNQHEIPDSLTFTLVNISDKQETFTLNLENDNHD